MKTGIIIQARTGSTRYPNKIIDCTFYKVTLLERVINTMKYALPDIPIVIATTKEKNDDIIIEYARKQNIDTYRGDTNDVLVRFIETANNFEFTNIIRVCSDNPFIDIDGVRILNSFSEYTNADYCSFTVNHSTPTIMTHFGFWVEIVKKSALDRVNTLTTNMFYREHVTKYIYEHKDIFDVKYIDAPYDLTSTPIRLTIDTPNDYKIAKEVADKLDNISSYNIRNILKVINDTPRLNDKMKLEILKNTK
jgi:spore coat polysaccharide biosynthesis protein SpsF